MKTLIDQRLRTEAERFRLRFSCEHCAHFDEDAGKCAEGYPNEEHTDGSLRGEQVLFCKLWEGA